MVLFKDINRTCNDLFTRDFPHEKAWDVEFTHKSKNPVFVQTAVLNPPGKLEAQSSLKHFGDWGSAETKLGTKSHSTEVYFRLCGIPRVLFGTKLVHTPSSSTPRNAEISLDYEAKSQGTKNSDIQGCSRNKLALLPHMKLILNPFKKDWSFSATNSIKVSNAATAVLGAEVQGSSDVRAIEYSFGGSYTHKSKDLVWSATLMGTHLDSRASRRLSSAIHVKGPELESSELGAEVSYGVKEAVTDVSFVGLWHLDKSLASTGKPRTTLKVKMSKDATVAASFTHTFSEYLTGIFGLHLDAFKPDSAKYGVKLNITA